MYLNTRLKVHSLVEISLKMMKNVFYFMLKSLFVLEYFCLDYLVTWKNGLTRKLRLISKFMTSQTGPQRAAIHILPNILRIKPNRVIKFGQLIKYNVRNVFHQKSYGK